MCPLLLSCIALVWYWPFPPDLRVMIWPAFSVRMRSKADCSRLLPSQQHQCSELIGFTQNTETGDDDAEGAYCSAFYEGISKPDNTVTCQVKTQQKHSTKKPEHIDETQGRISALNSLTCGPTGGKPKFVIRNATYTITAIARILDTSLLKYR